MYALHIDAIRLDYLLVNYFYANSVFLKKKEIILVMTTGVVCTIDSAASTSILQVDLVILLSKLSSFAK